MGKRPRTRTAAKIAVVDKNKDRIPAPMFPDLEGETWEAPAKPAWIASIPRASAAWDEKVERYRLRNQRIKGFEETLAQYCALEASLVEAYANGIAPNISNVREHRAYANAFFDTPASQQVTVAPDAKSRNPFARLAAMRS